MQDIVINNLTVSYGSNVVYDNFSYVFQAGKVHVLLGKSGCGKSTLLNAVAKLVDCSGSCSCDKLSYVFQNPCLAPVMVFQNVELVLKGQIKDKTERKNVVNKYLQLSGINHKANSLPSNLSGGEQQRVTLARAFAYDCQTLLMDEPFKSLDIGTKRQLYETFNLLISQSTKTTLFVTHDVDEALAVGDSIYFVGDKPSKIQKVCDIDVPASNRNLYDDKFVQLRKTLQQLFY